MPLDIPVTGMRYIIIFMFIVEELKDIELESVASSASGIILPLNEVRRERFHSMLEQLLHHTRRIRTDILTVDTPYIGLVFDGRQGIALEVFADTSHGVHDDDKGYGRAVVCLGYASVYTISAKQKVIDKNFFRG